MPLEIYVNIIIIVMIVIVMIFLAKISSSFCEYVNSFHGFGDEQDNNH
jgi:hypothetical protein